MATGYANLRWSAEQPAADGWWWWKPRPNAPRKPAEIWSITSAGVVLSRQCAHPNGILALENMSAAYPAQRWAGPLPEPEGEGAVRSSAVLAELEAARRHLCNAMDTHPSKWNSVYDWNETADMLAVIDDIVESERRHSANVRTHPQDPHNPTT